MSIGSVVQMPCPISECARRTVTLSSDPIFRNEFGFGSGFGARGLREEPLAGAGHVEADDEAAAERRGRAG